MNQSYDFEAGNDPVAVTLKRQNAARHEAGHALAAWWNGQDVHAVEMRAAEEAGCREDRRGREVDAGVRAYIEASTFIDAPALAAEYPEMMNHVSLELLREMVARDLLYALSGPAADWRNQRNPDDVCACLEHHLEEWLDGCGGDMEKANHLLVILPEEERLEAYTFACRRAEVLICQHWPELCALAERLNTPNRLEDDALEAALSATLGEVPEWRGNPLEQLDLPHFTLGSAEVVAWWGRSEGELAEWRLAATVDGVPLAPRITLEQADPDDPDDYLWDTIPDPGDWYWLENNADGEKMGTEAPPGGSPLRNFLADMVVAKLAELRRCSTFSCDEATQ